MLEKKVIFCIFSLILILVVSVHVTAFEYSSTSSYHEQNSSSTHPTPIVPPIVLVRGGLGISILIYGAGDETTIGAVVKDAIRIRIKENHILRNIVLMQVNVIKFLPGTFTIHVFVGRDVWSFECSSHFFVFVSDIKPIT